MRYLTIVLFLAVFQTDSGAQDPMSFPPADQRQSSVPSSAPADNPADVPVQTERTATMYDADTADNSTRMLTPAPVALSGQDMSFASEMTVGNYISTELGFATSYEDNIFATDSGSAVSDVIFSVRPAFSWYRSTSRLLWKSFYAPRFVIYHDNSSLDRTDQDLQLQLGYRLSPNVTLAFQDSFSKTANQLSSFEQSAISPIGTTQTPVATVVTPLADQITNRGAAQITYQFGLDSMVGATAGFTQLHYLDPSQAPGLFDSSSRAAQAFYTHRFAGRHYVGMRYEYQHLTSTPADTPNDLLTQTQGYVLFYTFFVRPLTSISFFAGPQHWTSDGGVQDHINSWSPTYGGYFAWQGVHTSIALRAERSISAGGGLEGAVRSISTRASLRRQLSPKMSIEMSGYYSNNAVLETASQFSSTGYSAAGAISLHRQVRDNLDVEVAYTRLQQQYSNNSALSQAPQDRISFSFGYTLKKPLGR